MSRTKRMPSFFAFSRNEEETNDIYQSDYLSNFYEASIKLNDKIYPSVEHYYQSMKFVTTDNVAAEKVRLAETPEKAKFLGRSRKFLLRDDWKQVKMEIMRSALNAKFTQHHDLKDKLIADNAQFGQYPSDFKKLMNELRDSLNVIVS